MAVKPIPDGYHTVTPYLTVKDAGKLLDFMKEAFGARETERMADPSGRVMHAEVIIGDSMIMCGDPGPDGEERPAAVHLYLESVDGVYQRALKLGATSAREPTDQFYGDRSAGVKDAFGNMWWLATHIEDVAPEEMQRRAEAAQRG